LIETAKSITRIPHMSLDDLPNQPPLNPQADRYGLECLARSREALRLTRSSLDIAYGSSYWQRLDVFGPLDGDHRDLPVLVFFHGGGWTHGYKEWCGFMAPTIVAFPALFVSVSYRLLPEVDFPAPMEDGLAAFKWVYDHIADHGGSRKRLFVGGHSAGGQIASLLAVRKDWRATAGLPADSVKGCFCISTTFNRRVVNEAAAPHLVTKEHPDEVSPDSSLAYAAGADVPFYITWGGQELERYDRFSRAMVEALRQAGCPVEWHRFDECNHFDIHLNTGDPDNLWTRTLKSWLERTR
jgi:acetyl esterase/lipase